VFHRIACSSFREQGEERFRYFTKTVLPEILRLKQTRTLVFIPSYLDFVRVRVPLPWSGSSPDVPRDSRTAQIGWTCTGRAWSILKRFYFVSLSQVRRYMMAEKHSHACISEYERRSETARSRSRFFHGHRDLLLYTGRAHFFKRFMIRGARHLVFYSLPEWAGFYSELVNLLGGQEGGEAEATSCLALFTRYEALALERIAGTERAKHMLASDKATFLFC
jgi:hypothetical protein